MRFMLLQSYGPVEAGCDPMPEWSPGAMAAHVEFQIALNTVLAEKGELIDAQGLDGPDAARFVVSDGVGAPVVTDGPFAEAKEVLGGYWMIQVRSREEAIEWAKRCPGGPNEIVEVRQVQEMSDFPADVQKAAEGFEQIQRAAARKEHA